MRQLFIAASMLLLAACGRAAEVANAGPEAPIADDASREEIQQTGEERAEAAGAELIAARAPDLKLRTIDGEVIDLAKLYGEKPVYLKFWATWCAPCLEQMPHFERAYETLGQDVQVVAVNTNFNETPEGIERYRRKHGLKMPIVIDDGRLAAAMNLRVTPTHVLIDRSGHIAFVAHSADKRLDSALQSIRLQPAVVAAPQDRVAAPRPAALRAAALTTRGASFSLKDPAGRKNTALVFFVPWCEGYLGKTQPATAVQCRSAREQADRLAARGDARLIGIASGLWSNAADMREYEARNHVGIPLALDKSGDLFRAYGVTEIPTVVVLDPRGKEIRRFTGDVAAFSAAVGKTQKETS